MKYSFSTEFLKIRLPDTKFGDAWESLCFELLAAERGLDGLQRLNAPDGGIDIWDRNEALAIQCKSNEQGALGSISSAESIKSLNSAMKARKVITWRRYSFATNANYTGSAVQDIIAAANAQGVGSAELDFLGPEYWSGLCEKHFERVREFLDFRITVSEQQVIEAFTKARYFDQYIAQFKEKIGKNPVFLTIKNNRTPLELTIPFSEKLTVENCVHAIQQLFGVSLETTKYDDLGTSVRSSISLNVDGKRQPFNLTLSEVQQMHPGKELVFWVKLIWSDVAEEQIDGSVNFQLYRGTVSQRSQHDRGKKTLNRAQEMVQQAMWNAAAQLKKGVRDGS